jgi:hypothetical protein
MYKEGVTFPTNLFFINEQLKISSIEEIKNTINITTDKSLDRLIQQINSSKGYVIVSLLINYFPNIIFRENRNKEKLKVISPFTFDNSGFNRCVLNNTISLNDLDNAIEQLSNMAKFDKSTLLNEIYLFIYKCYFCKIFNYVSFSDNVDNIIHIDFKKDIELYLRTKKFLDIKKPYEIKDYDAKKNFCERFSESFYVNSEIELLAKIENLFSHTRNEAMQTFGRIIKTNLKFDQNQTTYNSNRIFKPLFKIIYSFVLDKKFDDTPSSNDSLTKENKRFMSSLR